jgi:hypothetical protein
MALHRRPAPPAPGAAGREHGAAPAPGRQCEAGGWAGAPGHVHTMKLYRRARRAAARAPPACACVAGLEAMPRCLLLQRTSV